MLTHTEVEASIAELFHLGDPSYHRVSVVEHAIKLA